MASNNEQSRQILAWAMALKIERNGKEHEIDFDSEHLPILIPISIFPLHSFFIFLPPNFKFAVHIWYEDTWFYHATVFCQWNMFSRIHMPYAICESVNSVTCGPQNEKENTKRKTDNRRGGKRLRFGCFSAKGAEKKWRKLQKKNWNESKSNISSSLWLILWVVGVHFIFQFRHFSCSLSSFQLSRIIIQFEMCRNMDGNEKKTNSFCILDLLILLWTVPPISSVCTCNGMWNDLKIENRPHFYPWNHIFTIEWAFYL